jgi:hypothetical protein
MRSLKRFAQKSDRRVHAWASPRSGREHVAQGESASPGLIVRLTSPRSGRQQESAHRMTFAGCFAVARYAGLLLAVSGWMQGLAITQGSRTRPGLHAFARYAGFAQA